MEEELKAYVMSMFEGAPKTKKMIEVREEILSNVRERYRDLIASGATEQEAYDIAARSIGNIDEILQALEEPSVATGMCRPTEEEMEMRRNKAALNGVAVALYILSPVFVIAFSVIGNWLVGLILLFVCIAVATGLKVYSASVTKPYERADDSMVEEFKEWHRGRERQKTKMETYSGILWPLIVATYFILSFATHAWYITWIVFVIGAAVQQLIKLLVLSKER